MKTVAFVPIKLNNERLPGKNLKFFSDGTNLVKLVQKKLLHLKRLGFLDEIFIYCSDDSIKAFILDDVKFLKRDSSLDSYSTLGREIYNSFINMVESDIYLLAHATSPFISLDTYKKAILGVKSGEFDSAFGAKMIQSFMWQSNRPINFDKSNPPRTQDLVPMYMELSSPYVFTYQAFKMYGSRTGNNPLIIQCNEIESIDIDDKEDFELANLIQSNLYAE